MISKVVINFITKLLIETFKLRFVLENERFAYAETVTVWLLAIVRLLTLVNVFVMSF